jgi:hypothetical protein
MVFGTWHNPSSGARPGLLGFYHGASSRVLEMLAFRDVSKPRHGQRA